MNAGWKLQDGGRLDVESVKEGRRVKVEFQRGAESIEYTLTLSEARAVSSALMGAAAEA